MDLYLPRLLLQDKKESPQNTGAVASIYYHSLFDYPLTDLEVFKWYGGEKIINIFSKKQMKPHDVSFHQGYYHLKGSKSLILKRLLASRASAKKMKIAASASRVLSILPTISFIGVTGSLAMENAHDADDIDLMIITTPGSLWTSRLLSYFLLKIMRFKLRKPNDRNEKDKLCLNLWLDQDSLIWKKRNAFTAHEICQVVPLTNKRQTYESFLWQNKWVRGYWPNAVKIKDTKSTKLNREMKVLLAPFLILEPLAFWLQYTYMKKKMTIETITPNKALFHPFDFSKEIGKLFNKS